MTEGRASSLDEDQALVTAAFETAGIGVCFISEAGLFLRTNLAFCRMLGYAPEDVRGKHWSMTAPPDLVPKADRFLAALFADSPKIPAEWQIRCKDGSLMTALVTSRSITLENDVRRLIITFTDIHQRKVAEQRTLKHSQDLYRNVVENVSEGIVVVQDNHLILSNPRACELSGYNQQEMQGLPFAKLFCDDDAANVLDQMQQQMRQPTQRTTLGRHLIFRILRKDDSLLWVESSAVMIDWEGAPAMLAFLSDITERRRQEAALVKSEQHYREVINNVTEGILVVQDGVIVFANPRLLQLTGYTKENPSGLPFTILLHPDDQPKMIARHQSRVRGEEVEQHYTFRLVNRLTNEIIWAELSAVVIEWEGKPATLCFITDITRRKELDDRLKQSIAERDTILENSVVGMVFLDPMGRVQWANSAMSEIFGDDRHIPIGKSLESFYPSREDYLKTGAEVVVAVQKGQSYETELRMRRTDGSLFWIYLSGRAVNAKDLSQGTVWVVMDITKRRQLESDQEHYRQVVNNATECILVVQEGKMVFANPRVQEITGLSQDALFTTPFVNAIHPEDRALVVDHHTRRLRGENVEQYYQFRIIHQQSGALCWVELSAVMIDWEGRPATLSFMTDVTMRRRLEESLRQSSAERTRLQTLQIQNELKEAEVALQHAEETTRAKSMFLANMSHEIRTPMNAIIGMAHLALRTELNLKQRDYVEKIHGAGVSLLGIINDILDFSKIEAGKLDIEKIEFSLDDVLSNVVTVTSAKAQEKELEYLLQIPPSIPRNLIGDPLRLGQVLINLINNAIKFTDAGEVHVACRQCENFPDGRIQLEFTVRDTGIGMSQEQAKKLFRAFSQADESTTRKYGGTGLGLSISKGMVNLMGGQIWLESEWASGTSIHFTAGFDYSSAQKKSPDVPPAIHGMRVLVVDDNPVARVILAEELSVLPVEVDLASSGHDALAAIRSCDQKRPYSVVFTDLRMPELDGIELIGIVKKDGHLQSPPRMVLVTAHGRDEAQLRAEHVCVDGFLTKPVGAGMLVDTLVELFAPVPMTAQANLRSPTTHFFGLTILLVEDNEINQQIAVELMEAAGIVVQVADNGRIAVEMVRASSPDFYGLVFMDVQMPEMDGHEAARRIRSDARFDALPIIAMTAHAMAEERLRCLDSGMNEHLTKPINPDDLYRTIRRWCPAHVSISDVATTPSRMQRPVSETDGEEQLIIDGVDVQDGLSRTLDNRAFYLQLLSRFHDDQGDTVSRIRAALDDNDRLLAERLAHTLKGVAGQLGIRKTQTLANQVVTEIQRDADATALYSHLDRLEADMIALQRELSSVLPDAIPVDDGADALSPEIDRAAAAEVINGFARLLRDYDGEAIDYLIESNQLLAAALGGATHRRIVRAARQFDFDAALAALLAGAESARYKIL